MGDVAVDEGQKLRITTPVKGNPIPGAHPNKHDFPNFTNICKIFLQICVKFLTTLVKMNLTICLQILLYNYYLKNWLKMI
jgi:hypothetical protein